MYPHGSFALFTDHRSLNEFVSLYNGVTLEALFGDDEIDTDVRYILFDEFQKLYP